MCRSPPQEGARDALDDVEDVALGPQAIDVDHAGPMRVEGVDVEAGGAVEIETLDLADDELALEERVEDELVEHPEPVRRTGATIEVQGARAGDRRHEHHREARHRRRAPSRRRTRDGAPPAPGPMGIVAATPQR